MSLELASKELSIFTKFWKWHLSSLFSHHFASLLCLSWEIRTWISKWNLSVFLVLLKKNFNHICHMHVLFSNINYESCRVQMCFMEGILYWLVTVIVWRMLPKNNYDNFFALAAMSGENRENTLFYSEIPKSVNRAAVSMLSWKPLLDLFQVGLTVVLPALWYPFWDAAFIQRQKASWSFSVLK